MVYWITGRKNSGKTTLAYRLQAQIPNSVVLDGDEMREISGNNDFSREGRNSNLFNIARLAVAFEKQGLTVIVACVSPYRGVRENLQKWFKECIEICMPFGELWEGTTYEEPEYGKNT
jgi:adenylylsulfate kinase-like enzyme